MASNRGRGYALRLAQPAILLLGFGLRLYRLDYQELRGDEVFGYLFSLRPVGDMVRATIELREPHPVASYLVEKAWLAGAGQSEFALRFVSVWFSVLAIALIYRLGRRLGLTPAASSIAMLLMAISPYAIWHAQDARMYSMSLALTTASTLLMLEWLYARGSRARRWGWALAYIAVSLLALHTHYFAVFVLVAHFLFVMGRGILVREERRTLLPWLLIQGAVGLLYLPWLLLAAETLTTYVGNGDSPGIADMARRALSVLAAGESVPPDQRVLLAALAGTLLLIGAVRLFRAGDRGVEAAALLLLYLLVPLGATWFSARQRPIFNERYLAAALTPFLLLIGAVFQHPRPAEGAAGERTPYPFLRLTGALLFSLLLLAGLASLQRYYTDPAYSKTRGWRELAARMDAWSAGLPPGQAMLAENFPDPTLWYYYDGPLEHTVLPPAPQDRAGAQAEVERLAQAGVERIVIPLQPAPNWDDLGLAPAALAARYALIAEQPLNAWTIQAYARPPALAPRDDRFANGVVLAGAAVSPQTLTPGGLLAVFLNWRLEDAALAGGEKVFVQLIGPDGGLVAQDDRPLDAPLAAYGLLLPDRLAAGAYQLIAGLYDPGQAGAPRIPTEEGADHVVVETFEVR
jgi:hypothetical protein